MKKYEGADGAAFLLAQLGAHAAAKFAERLQPLGLAPAHAGILRVLREMSGSSQQVVATKLGMHSSRLVGLIDELEQKGLVDRRATDDDRRVYALHLTEKGQATLGDIGRVSREHQRAVLAALREDERAELASLLRRVAQEQGLMPGVHPGYGRIGRKASEA